MPEMDGIETTARLREMGGKFGELPVIALTANAVFGAKELFLKSGFNDFLSKPINTGELVTILKNWLPHGKITDVVLHEAESADSQDENNSTTELGKIEEINVKIGLERVSGVEELYLDSVKFFSKKLLSECAKMSGALREKNISSFAITVHAIKSSLSTIGAMKLSDMAAELEAAAKNNDNSYCVENYLLFEEKLHNLHERLSAVFSDDAGCDARSALPGDEALLRESVEKALAAADDFDSDEGIEILEELIKYDFGENTNILLQAALSAFNDFDCSTAAEKLKKVK
jgi:CheY-like chemotaxis protein